jgi:hypothetical protein
MFKPLERCLSKRRATVISSAFVIKKSKHGMLAERRYNEINLYHSTG